jgi:hypothetical protein
VAEMGVFIGWGDPIPGREAKGLEVFEEAIDHWGRLQQDGQIESFEVVLLYPHGGDLSGFFLLRGSGEALDEMRASEEFDRLINRAGLVVQSLGIVSAALGGSLGPEIERYRQAIADIT